MANSTEKRTVIIEVNGKQAGGTIKDLEQESRKLTAEWRKMTIGTEEYIEKTKELQAVNMRLKAFKDEAKGTKSIFSELKDEIKSMGMIAIGAFGFEALTGQIGGIIARNAELSDSLANVRKTTGLTQVEVEELNQELSKLDTRSSRAELLALGEEAGKLGYGTKKEVLEFIKVTDQVGVALGDAFGDKVEEAVNNIGVLNNIFKVQKEYGLEKSYLKTGSALNDLAASGIASEPFIVEFTKRLGGVAPAAKITIQEVMGIGAAVEELGLTAEVSSTSIGALINSIGKDTQYFAELVGMTKKEFEALLNRDANEALLKVLESAKSTKGGMIGVADTLNRLGEEGARASSVFGALTDNVDKIRASQDVANKSFAAGTSLTNEFNIKNATLGATVDRLNKQISSLFTSKEFETWVKAAVYQTGNLVDALRQAPAWFKENRTWIELLAAGYVVYNRALIANKTAQALTWVETKAKVAWEKISGAIMAINTIRTNASTIANELRNGSITRGVAVQRLWNAVLAASGGPLGLAILGVTALVVAMSVYSRNTAAAAEEELKMKAARDLGNESVKTADALLASLNTKLENYTKLSAEARKATLTEGEQSAKAISAEIAALTKARDEAIAAAQGPNFFERIADGFSTEGVNSSKEEAEARLLAEKRVKILEESNEKIQKLQETRLAIEAKVGEAQSKENSEAEADAIMRTTASRGQLTEALNKYNVALDLTIPGSQNAIRVLGKLAEAQKRLSATETSVSSPEEIAKAAAEAKKRQDEQVASTKKMMATLRDLQIEAISDEQEREEAKLKESALRESAQIAAEKGDAETKAALLLAIDEKLKADLLATGDKFSKERAEAEYDVSMKSLTNWDIQQKIALTQMYAQGLITKARFDELQMQQDQSFLDARLTLAKDYGKETIDIDRDIAEVQLKERENTDSRIANERMAGFALAILQTKEGSRERMEAELAQLAEQHALELENSELTDTEKLVKIEEFELRKLEIQAQYRQLEEDARAEAIAKQISAFEDAANQIGDLMKAGADLNDALIERQTAKDKKELDKQLKNLDKNFNKEKAALDAQLASKAISQEVYNQKLTALEQQHETSKQAAKAETDAKAKESARNQAKIQKSLAAFEIVTATAVAIIKALAMTPPNPPLAIIAGVTGAVSLAAVLAKPLPELAKGGFLGEGHTHAEGGMLVVDRKSGKAVQEVEVGEMVLSRETVKNNPIAWRLLKSSQEEGGAYVDPSAYLPTVNFSSMRESLSQPAPRFATGGIVGGGKPIESSAISNQSTALLQRLVSQNELLLRAINDANIQNVTALNEQKIVIPVREVMREIGKTDAIRAKARISAPSSKGSALKEVSKAFSGA